jgi:hypothetical protein
MATHRGELAMGRGLSGLQRWALCKVYRNHVDEGRVPVAATIEVCGDGSMVGALKLMNACEALGVQPSYMRGGAWHAVIVPPDPGAYQEAKAKAKERRPAPVPALLERPGLCPGAGPPLRLRGGPPEGPQRVDRRGHRQVGSPVRRALDPAPRSSYLHGRHVAHGTGRPKKK